MLALLLRCSLRAVLLDEKITFGFIHQSNQSKEGTGTAVKSLPIQYVSCRFGEAGTLTMTPSG